MTPSDGCSKPLLIALAIAASLLSACATGASEGAVAESCPPLVAYDRAFLERAADELELLREGSAIEQMLGDYAVMREQARVCIGP
jgi:hypothetical protein